MPKAAVTPEVWETTKHLTQESSVIVTGRVRADQRAPGGYELDVENIEVVQRVPEEPALPHHAQRARRRIPDGASPPLAPLFAPVGDAAHPGETIKASRDYLLRARLPPYDPPILTPAACEGTWTLFPIEYFGRRMAYSRSGANFIASRALAFGKVYSFGPTFRAEQSKTRRHLNEFWMVEPELALLRP